MSSTDFRKRLADLWQDDDMRFEAKAQSIAIALASAVHETGMTRAQLAEKLGWKPSRVTKILTGSENLTLRTIHQVCAAIGLEFDMVLRQPGERTVIVGDRQTELLIKTNLGKNRPQLEVANWAHQRTQQQVRDSRRFTRHELSIKVPA